MKKNTPLQGILLLLGIGLLYFIWVKVTGLAIPCPFRSITGWKCPGCGITTLIMNLAKLDVRAAFLANPFLFVTGPFLLAELIYECILRRKTNSSAGRLPKWNRICLILYAVALCVFGAARNLL